MYALHSVLYEQEQDRIWQAYTANSLWNINRCLTKDYPVKSYTEMLRTMEKPMDTRSGSEILEDVKARFKSALERDSTMGKGEGV